MDKINIGFMGGCLSTQRGMKRNHLYYSVMSTQLQKNKKHDYRISFYSYLSYDQLAAKTGEFISEKKPDILFLFIRPFPLMPLQKPFVKYDKNDGTQSWALHPVLFSRKLMWNDLLSEHQSINNHARPTRNKFGLRDLNLIAGIALGLHHWSRKYIAKQIGIAGELCRRKSIRLKIISPPKNPESVIANYTCKWITNYLDQFCRKQKLDFININTFTIENFEQDRIHFNIQGHRQLGELLSAEFS